MEAFFRTGRIVSCSFIAGFLFVFAQFSALAAGNVTVSWQASDDTSVVGYKVYFGGASGVYTNTFSVVGATNAVISGLVPGATYYFAITAYDDSGLESPFSNEASYAVPVNVPPTLNTLGNLAINANTGSQTVSLSGISSGAANESQTLAVTAVSSNPALIPNPTVSYVSANSSGSLTFAPANNASGTATITVTVDDGQTQNNTITRSFTVTVNAVNQAPTLNALANLTLNQNTGSQTVNLSGISTGGSGEIQTLNVTAVSSNPALIPNPTVSYVSANSTGSLTFTPVSNASGTTTISVSVNDGGASNNIVTRTFIVTVNAVNQVPTLNTLGNLALSQNAGSQTVSLSGISSGAANESQILTVTALSSNPALIPNPTVSYASPNSTGSLSFTPVSNASGIATISVTVNDGSASNNIVTQTFAVTVNTVNQTPTLNVLNNLAINQNAGSQTVNLSGISSGAANESQILTVTAVSSNPALIPNPTVNYISANSTGSLSFTPVSNASGTANITVTVNDGGASNNIVTRSFTVTVNAVNQNPTLNALGNLAINENAGSQTVNLTGISSGAANESQTLVVTAVSSNPTLVPNPTVSYVSANATGSLTFTPVSNASGTTIISVSVNDGGASNNIVTRTFTVTVNAVNQVPTLNGPENLTVNENAGLQTVSLSGLSSGAANESQTLTVTVVSSNPALIPNPTVNYASANTTGSLSFTPVNNASGTTTISVSVNDGGASNNIATRTFTVTVNAVNQAPTLNGPGNLTMNENAGLQTVSLSGISSGAATEAQTLTVTAVSSNPVLIPNPTISYVSANSAGSLTFTPANNISGTATISVTVNDGGTSNNIVTRTFTVTVNAVNQIPTLNALSNLAINQNAGLQTVSLSGISSGAANESQTLAVTAVSSNPALIPNPTVNYASANTTGSLSFTPVSSASGTATISVSVNDGGASNNIVTRTFTVTVNGGNQAPTLNVLGNLNLSQNSGSQTVSLSGISSGAANESQTLTVTAVSSNPDLIPTPTVSYASPNTTGTLTFAPVSFATGTAIITVTVNDGQAQNNTTIRTFTVSVANQPPTLNGPADLAIMTNSGVHTVNLSGISSGAANEIQFLTVTAVSSNPALIPNPTVSYANANTFGTVTFVPANNATGTATISVTVDDGQAQNNMVTRTFTVTVTDVNQLPTLDTPANLAINANAGLQTVNLSGISSGAANEIQTLTVTASSSNPALIPNPTVNYASANATGTLTFTPVSNGTGTATITVTVNDGQAQNNTITRTFTVTVKAPNTPPTLNAPANLAVDASSGLQTVNLSGISAGAASEMQTLTVTAVSSNPALILNPTVNYASANTTGTLTFTPVNSATGTATISVTVNDGQAQSNTVTRTFTVTVNAAAPVPTLNPISDFYITKNAPAQTVTLTGISPGATTVAANVASKSPAPKPTTQKNIKITAVSGNTKLLTNPTIRYSSGSSSGVLTFKPVKNATGTTTITVTVNNGAKVNNIAKTTFRVTILATAAALPAKLTPAAHVNGQFAFAIAGVSGAKFIVQASTNMINWVPVQTNTAPFTFTDTQAGQFSQRFYRSVSLP